MLIGHNKYMNPKTPIVYFACAIRGNRVVHTLLQEMVSHIKSKGIAVLSEHVVDEDARGAFAKAIGKKDADITPIDIERQDIAWLNQATHVIADISGASTGVGREVEYARTKGDLGQVSAQVLCLYHSDHADSATSMITGMTHDRYPNVTISSYTDIKEAVNHIDSFLHS